MDALTQTTTTTKAATEPPPSLLVLVLDTSPAPWHILSQSPYDLPLLPTAISQLLLFINAHLAFSHENRVAVLAAHTGSVHWLYPSPHESDDGRNVPTDANKYRSFAVIEHTILKRLSALLASTSLQDVEREESDDSPETPIAGALTTALSYINRTIQSLQPSHPQNNIGSASASIPYDDRGHGASTNPVLDARCLVVSVSGDLAGQYIPLMNAMFAAQSLNVPIDCLKLSGDAALLQQCSHTTGGVFITPAGSPASFDSAQNQMNGTTKNPAITLIPPLFQALLPTSFTRNLLNPPKMPTVDFRAACFCHRRVVDLGFVCSICLSIFCDEGVGIDVETLGKQAGSELNCLTCGSKLVLARVGADVVEEEGGKKKKKKKDKGKGAAEAG